MNTNKACGLEWGLNGAMMIYGDLGIVTHMAGKGEVRVTVLLALIGAP